MGVDGLPSHYFSILSPQLITPTGEKLVLCRKWPRKRSTLDRGNDFGLLLQHSSFSIGITFTPKHSTLLLDVVTQVPSRHLQTRERKWRKTTLNTNTKVPPNVKNCPKMLSQQSAFCCVDHIIHCPHKEQIKMETGNTVVLKCAMRPTLFAKRSSSHLSIFVDIMLPPRGWHYGQDYDDLITIAYEQFLGTRRGSAARFWWFLMHIVAKEKNLPSVFSHPTKFWLVRKSRKKWPNPFFG